MHCLAECVVLLPDKFRIIDMNEAFMFDMYTKHCAVAKKRYWVLILCSGGYHVHDTAVHGLWFGPGSKRRH